MCEEGVLHGSLARQLKLDQVRFPPAVTLNPADSWPLLHMHDLHLWVIWKHIQNITWLCKLCLKHCPTWQCWHLQNTFYYLEALCLHTFWSIMQQEPSEKLLKGPDSPPKMINTLKQTNLCRHSRTYLEGVFRTVQNAPSESSCTN